MSDMMKRFKERRAAAGGPRGDLYLSEIKPMGSNHAARIMVGYHADAQEPSLAEVEDFVIKSFSGKVIPLPRSAARHPDVNGFSLQVQAFVPRRPIADAEKMTRVTGSMYTDAENVFWEVSTGEDGTTFLARKQEASLVDLLNMKKASASHKNASFDRTKVSAAVVYPGDVVKGYTNDGQLYVGSVISLQGEEMRVQPRQGNEIKASLLRVISVEQRTAELDNAMKSKLVEYYTKAYGDADYARKLVEGM